RRARQDGDRDRAERTARVRGDTGSGDAGGDRGGRTDRTPRGGGVGGRCAADRQSIARTGRVQTMTRKMMRAKIHRATVTEANIDYEGSITIDRRLMDARDLPPNRAGGVRTRSTAHG